ncbi:MAG: pyruvate formate lyase family protein, partial [Anaerolineae bacterium]|nr:pyruvate formate lyase family protein [Anaerolineae bacterium]
MFLLIIRGDNLGSDNRFTRALATKLTRQGLGFPQYSNDDVVIPALVAHGYEIEDARDYTVAACGEFIIPGMGMDIVNIGAVSLPAAVDHGIRVGLTGGDKFGDILDSTAEHIEQQVGHLVDTYRKLLLPPAPYYSVVMDGCLERGPDLCHGLKYNNFGLHGAASSDAADALATVKKHVFDSNDVAPSE